MAFPPAPQRTTPGFSFSIVQRCLLDCLAVRQFGKAEMTEVVTFFGAAACAYYGATPIERWDHLVPVSRGGDTVLGNVVPACARCDDSKRDKPYAEWALSATPGSPRSRGVLDIEQRLERIEAYATHHEYVPALPAERLSEEELRQYERIQEDLARLRADIDRFIVLYRERAHGDRGGGHVASLLDGHQHLGHRRLTLLACGKARPGLPAPFLGLDQPSAAGGTGRLRLTLHPEALAAALAALRGCAAHIDDVLVAVWSSAANVTLHALSLTRV